MTEEQIEQYIREHYSDIIKFTKQFAIQQNWDMKQVKHVCDWLAKFK